MSSESGIPMFRCPHGNIIIETVPGRTNNLADPIVGRVVDPWPCAEAGCSIEAWEASHIPPRSSYER